MNEVNLVLAYLDPGTGSVVIQSLIGVAAGIGVFGRKAIAGVGHKVRSLVGRKKDSDN